MEFQRLYRVPPIEAPPSVATGSASFQTNRTSVSGMRDGTSDGYAGVKQNCYLETPGFVIHMCNGILRYAKIQRSEASESHLYMPYASPHFGLPDSAPCSALSGSRYGVVQNGQGLLRRMLRAVASENALRKGRRHLNGMTTSQPRALQFTKIRRWAGFDQMPWSALPSNPCFLVVRAALRRSYGILTRRYAPKCCRECTCSRGS